MRVGRWAAWALGLAVASGGPASPAPAADVPHVPISEEVLPNGLKVLLVEAPKAPVVSVQVWYRAGSRNEVGGTTGLSHMLEHMMFRGTASVPGKEFSALIEKAGGSSNAYTYQDATAYVTDLPAERLEVVLRLEADRMANLLLEEGMFAAERDVVMEERRGGEDDPVSSLYEVLYPMAFAAHPYAHPIVGWMEDLQGMRLEDLRRHYRTYYLPNNAALVVAGAVRPSEALPLIRRLFGGIPSGPDPPPVRAARPPQRGERRVMLRREASLPHVAVAYAVPNARDPDSLALDLLEVILAGGNSSRLHHSLVYEQRLALSASAGNHRLSLDPHLFTVSAEPLPGRTAEEVEHALEAEIERLKREPVSGRELQKAKNWIEADFVMGQDSVSDLGEAVMSFELVTSWRDYHRYLADIRVVTAADLQRVAQKYLVREARTVGILVPLAPEP
jgi:zinc protease